MDKNQINSALNDTLELLEAVKFDEKKLRSLQIEYDNRCHDKNKAFKQLEKENKDVDKITGVSFQSFVATLLKNRDEKLEKEELEAIEAKRVYDAIVYDIENLTDEIESLKSKVRQKTVYQAAYDQALQEKKDYVVSQSPEAWAKIEETQLLMQTLGGEVKELREAIHASGNVISTSNNALSELTDAKNLGVWDMLGGGLLVTMAKRDHMAKAQTKINEMNYSLKRFSKELEDVNMYLTTDIEIGNYMSFADYFFDGFFMDMMVQNKIDSALSSVTKMNNQVRTVKGQLSSRLSEKETERKRMILSMEEWIINA